MLFHLKCTFMYPVKRFSCLHTCVWLLTASQLFLGDVYGISEQIEKIGADTSLYRLLKDYNIVTGGLSQCLSLSPLEIK